MLEGPRLVHAPQAGWYRASARGERRIAHLQLPSRVSRRRFIHGGLGAAGALSLGPLFAACGSDDGDGGGAVATATVGFSFLYSEVPAAKVLKETARERAEQVGYTLLTDNIRGGAVDQQLQSLDSYLTRNVDAVVVHAVEPSGYGGQLDRFRDAEIPFISYATQVPGADAAILFPPLEPARELGEHAARYINENLGGTGEVLLLTFTGDEQARAASRAFGEAIERETDARVVARQDAVDQATGLRITEDTLEANPDLNCAICWNDGGALGAAQAMKNAGKDPEKVFVASSEAGEDGLRAMLNGPWLKALEALDIAGIGRAIIDVPKRIIDKSDTQDEVIGRVLVTRDDEEQIRKLLAVYER